ncbi:MAG: flagellar biosynthesis protein FlhB [Limnochordaceae bacterium]|nr:flagellar biosynthesis protein FlhB [Limnochordaceae bacterium]
MQRFADGERTEPATPRRRQEARKRGQVARSMDLTMALVILGGALMVRGVARLLIGDVRALGTRLWGGAFWEQDLTLDTLRQVGWAGLVSARGVVPFVVGVGLAGLAAQVAQVGFLASGTPLEPQLARINPVAGFGRLFSARSLVELAKSAAKALVVFWAAYGFIRDVVTGAGDMVGSDPLRAAAWVGELAYGQLLRMGLVLLVIGIADYAYQRWEYEQSLRMSRHELLDELKQSEGDPHVRSRIRSRMRQIAMRRMMQQVPRASVVVTNPTHVAVALAYEPDRMEAPEVVAKGQDWLAQRIVQTAREHGVPVVENPPLAWSLWDTAEVGQAIPPDLYRAVAEVLAYVYRLRRPAGAAGRRR